MPCRRRSSPRCSSGIARESAQFESPAAAPLLRDELPPVDDDQLGLLFLTCHPSLPADARVALALKLVGGFGVGEIARAFLARDSAIAQRLVRAKRLLREDYAATSGDHLIRDDVATEAIRLARMIALHPATAAPRAPALLALMLLHAARFPARVDSDGTLFLLREQDRRKWDRAVPPRGGDRRLSCRGHVMGIDELGGDPRSVR